jgi:hypothetical protein
MDYAKADLILTEEHFRYVKGKELEQPILPHYELGTEWRRAYGEPPSDVVDRLRVLAARVRECREAVERLEAVTPQSIIADRQAKTDAILRRNEQDEQDRQWRRQYLAQINSINL